MAKKGILITGGSGLVGAYAVQMLMERGERPVIFDVALNERLLGAVGVDTSKVTMIRGDMADMPALISAVRDHDCDQIIHLAAFLGEEVQRRPYSGVRLNFMGTINVFEAARLENVKRVVFPEFRYRLSWFSWRGHQANRREYPDEPTVGLRCDQGELRIYGPRLRQTLRL